MQDVRPEAFATKTKHARKERAMTFSDSQP